MKLFPAAFICAVAAFGSIGTPAAADTLVWNILKYHQPNTCVAAGPSANGATLSIATLGPETKVLIASGDFRFADGTYPISISIDGGRAAKVNALGEANVYGIAVTHDFGLALRSASMLAVRIRGKSYTFDVAHADRAMDEASKCADEPTFAQVYAHPPRDIPGANGWTLVENSGAGNRCSIRKNGKDVDTSIIRSDDGSLVLMAGRASWAFPQSDVRISLRFDDSPRQNFAGHKFDNLVLVSINDPGIQDRLKHATRLSWYLPWGEFRADVSGMSVALDALADCDRKKAGK